MMSEDLFCRQTFEELRTHYAHFSFCRTLPALATPLPKDNLKLHRNNYYYNPVAYSNEL